MAEMVVSLNRADVAKLNGFILKLSEGLSSSSLRQFVYTNARPHLQARARARFESEGDDASGPWDELKDTTAKIRISQAKKYGWAIAGKEPINRRTGALRAFVTRTFDIDEGWREVSLTIPSRSGTDRNLERKLTHAQRGGITRAGTSFSARPVAIMDETDKARLESRFGAWIDGMLRTIV